jgi:hypothetical protein
VWLSTFVAGEAQHDLAITLYRSVIDSHARGDGTANRAGKGALLERERFALAR